MMIIRFELIITNTSESECLLQTEEESKMSHHRSPNVVHPDGPGHLKTFHQVRMHSVWFIVPQVIL